MNRLAVVTAASQQSLMTKLGYYEGSNVVKGSRATGNVVSSTFAAEHAAVKDHQAL